MSVPLSELLVVLAGTYLGIGILFAGPFVLKGVSRIDPTAAGGTVGFKILILPGVVALWPLLARRWLTGTSAPPEEKSPHRVAARTAPRRLTDQTFQTQHKDEEIS